MCPVLLASVAGAQAGTAPSKDKHSPVRFECGGFQCAVIYAGRFEMDPAQLFAGADPDVLSQTMKKYGVPSGTITFRIQSLYVDTGKNRVIIDPGGIDDSGVLLASLRDAGVDPGSIDTVVITHGHYDHFRGSVAADGSAAFPNARYILQSREWDHWVRPDNQEQHLAEGFRKLLVPLRERFRLLEGEEVIVPGITAVPAPGHSPAHMVVLIGGKALYTGDVLLTPVQVEHPDWPAKFDLWPREVVATRRALLDRIVRDKLLVVTTHFAPPNTGRVDVQGNSWRWTPVNPD